MTTTKQFQRLTIITVITLFVLITVGGIVRVTGSDLGCPDWPLCYGQVVPPREVTAWIEFSHRVVAAIGGLLMLATAGIIWHKYRALKALFIPAVVQIGLLAVQVPLGGVIVFTELEPLAVAIHLGQAMIIFALAIVIAIVAHRHDAANINAPKHAFKPGYVRLLGGAALAAYILLISGALVVGTQSSYACPGWPLCNGQVIPGADSSPKLFIQMGHRYTVAAVSILLTASAFFTLRREADEQAPGARWWAVALVVLLVGQITVGAVQVITHLQWYWRALHLAMASAVWASLVGLVVTTVVNGVLIRAPAETHEASIPAAQPGK